MADIYVGEIFDNAPNRRFLDDRPVGPRVLRGAHIERYLLRDEATQGKNRYLKETLFLRSKSKASKLEFLQHDRVGLQRGAAVDNWRRLIACIVPAGVYCFDTVLLLCPRRIPREVVLGLVNSDLWEWRFRCTSTTNHVNEYELEDLPIPPVLLDPGQPESRELSTMVAAILATHANNARTSEHQMASVDSGDRRIDELVFKLYGVTKQHREIIDMSLNRRAGSNGREGAVV